MGIVVPAAVPQAKKDSVEVLLEGMTTPQPPRTKTMPQTDGEASAAYHARHDVRAARTSPDDEPKVIVERAPASLAMPAASTRPPTPLELAPTVPELAVDRLESGERRALDKRAADARLPTAELPPRLGPRIALASAAGMLVVLFLFVALAALRANRPVEERGPSAATVLAEPSAAAPVASASAVPAPPPVAAVAIPSNSTTQVATAPPRSRVREKAAAAAASAVSSVPDLSELKTTFH
jgi:hypothetical protein